MYSPTKDLFLMETGSVSSNHVTALDKNSFAIIITGRCGSTWLTRLLEETGSCGIVDEFFNEISIPQNLKTTGALTLDGYIESLVNKYGFGSGFGFQIDPMRLAWLQSYKTMSVETLFQRIGRIIYMTRNEIISQAYSFARAKASGVWHVLKNSSEKRVDSKIDNISDSTLWEEMLSILHDEFWAERAFSIAGVKPIRLTYEDLVADPNQIISKLLIAVGRYPDGGITIGGNSRKVTKKVSYSTRDSVITDFYQRYLPVLIEMQEMRRRSVMLKEYFSLLDKYGIVFNKKSVRWYPPPKS
jgi:LPS sulfotransferase NodH